MSHTSARPPAEAGLKQSVTRHPVGHRPEDYCRSCRPLHNLVDAPPVNQRDYPTEWTLPVLLKRSSGELERIS